MEVRDLLERDRVVRGRLPRGAARAARHGSARRGRAPRLARRAAAGGADRAARGDRAARRRPPTRGSSRSRAGATSASSSAAPSRPRSRPTGSPRPGTRTRASTSPGRRRPWSRRSRARGWPSCSACRRRLVRLRHRLPDGPLHRPRRRAARRARARRLGRRGARPRRRAAGPRGRRARSGTRRSTARSASSASARRASSRSQPTARAGWSPTRFARRSSAWTGRRSSAPRRATSTPAPSTRSTPIADAAEEAGAWLHVDGAFGLWAAVEPRAPAPRRAAPSAPTPGRPTPTSGSTFPTTAASRSAPTPTRTARRWASARATSSTPTRAARATSWTGTRSSRGGRAASRSTRRSARSAAPASPSSSSAAAPTPAASARRSARRRGVEVLNDVVLNQVLVRFGDDDARRSQVIERVQEDGTCWLSGTTWQRHGGDADLGLELVDDRGRRRPLDRGDPARRRVVRFTANNRRRLTMLADSPVVAVVAVSDLDGAKALLRRHSRACGRRGDRGRPAACSTPAPRAATGLVYQSGYAGGTARRTSASAGRIDGLDEAEIADAARRWVVSFAGVRHPRASIAKAPIRTTGSFRAALGQGPRRATILSLSSRRGTAELERGRISLRALAAQCRIRRVT